MYKYSNSVYKHFYRLTKKPMIYSYYNGIYVNKYFCLHTDVPFKLLRKNRSISTSSISINKLFCSQDSSDDGHLHLENSISVSFLDVKDKQFYNLICPNINLNVEYMDPFLIELQSSSTLEEIFETLEKYPEPLSLDQACQAVFSLSQVKNMRQLKFRNSTIHSIPDEDFHAIVNTQPEFLRVTSVVKENIMNLKDRIPSLMMCLDNLKIELHYDLLVALHINVLKIIPDLDLISLAQLSFVFNDRGIKSYFTQCKILRKVNAQIENCTSLEDLRLISVIYSNTKKLVSEDTAFKYLYIVQRFLEENLHDAELDIILLILKVLCNLFNKNPPIYVCRSLMKLLINKVQHLTPQQLVVLNSVFLHLLEPRSIMYKIQEHASCLIDECNNIDLKTELLLCVAPHSSFKMRSYYESLTSEQIGVFHNYQNIDSLFKTLRLLRSTDFNLCCTFWLKSLKMVKAKLSECEDSLGKKEKLLYQIYGKYIFFNNNLGGSFRAYKLEEELLSFLEKELRGPAYHLPKWVARMIGFLIAYSETLSEDWYKHLKRNAHQFNIYDLAFLSKGIETQMSQKFQEEKKIYFLTRVGKLFDQCTDNLLKKHLSLSDVVTLTAAYLKCQGSTSSSLFDTLAQEHLKYLNQLNSKTVQRMLKNFKLAHYNTPEVFESVTEYILKNEESILFSTIHIVLACFDALGFCPSKVTEFVTVCQKILEMDCEKMPCHYLLESCIALCSYEALSSELIHYIFNIQFLDQVDEEIISGYSQRYSLIVRSLLMKLNRAVCLDYPEEKIPWFHEKYCRDQCELNPQTVTSFHNEVYEVLASILGNGNTIFLNRKSPYYYNLDLEFALSHEGKPIPPHELGENKPHKELYKRVAVLLRNDKCYSSNDYILTGHCQLERRHLEILGYVVVEVPQHSWVSMAVSSKKDKINLLKSLIYKELSTVS